MKNSVIKKAIEKAIQEAGHIKHEGKFLSLTGCELIRYDDYETIPAANRRYVEFSKCFLGNEEKAQYHDFDMEANYRLICKKGKTADVFSPADSIDYGSLVYNLKLVTKYISKKKTDKFEYAVLDSGLLKILKNDKAVAYICPIKINIQNHINFGKISEFTLAK